MYPAATAKSESSSMHKRPLPVTIISWLLIAAGAVGFLYHAAEIKTLHPFPGETVGIELIRLLAILSGIFMLRGHNWARWLAIFWIGFHTVLSIFHSPAELAMHALLLVVFTFFLFRRNANLFFRTQGAELT